MCGSACIIPVVFIGVYKAWAQLSVRVGVHVCVRARQIGG